MKPYNTVLYWNVQDGVKQTKSDILFCHAEWNVMCLVRMRIDECGERMLDKPSSVS